MQRLVTQQTNTESINWLPVFLILSLLLPVYFFIGPIRLTLYRLILMIAIIPLCVRFFSSGKPIYGFDILIILSFLWSALSLSVLHGLGTTIETSAIYIIEGLGAYLATRVLVTNRRTFRTLIVAFYFSVLALIPFAIYEAITGQPILLDVLRKFLPVPGSIVQDKRLGLERAQVVFEHSILFGVYCSSVFGLVYYVLNRSGGSFVGIIRLSLVFFASILSVSTGALLAIFVQTFFIIWDRATAMMKIPKRWWLLASGFFALYVLIDLFSHRSPFHVFVNYLTFSSRSAYNRILIWEFGTETIIDTPIFGIGLGRWLGPGWMGDSIDNFWLLLVMRYGIPGGFMFIIAVYLIMKKVGSAEFTELELGDYRKGYMVSLGGMVIAGATVHYWNATYVLLMLVVGSGVWLLDAKEQIHEKTDASLLKRWPSFSRTTGANVSRPQFTAESAELKGMNSKDAPHLRFENSSKRASLSYTRKTSRKH